MKTHYLMSTLDNCNYMNFSHSFYSNNVMHKIWNDYSKKFKIEITLLFKFHVKEIWLHWVSSKRL